ncbi:DUF4270 family protein [Ohtaekwangia kribbensis]|jgi:hypothetical protein|uniref:DUF4270 family protein n=1 Tax=Ohtaekwangia kribbensis TaxID=688913 RepID=A0ABW3K6S6_9BACT
MKQILFVLAVLTMASCGVDSSEIGTDFFNEGALDFSYIDSSSVKLSTIRIENLTTAAGARILLGSHTDEKLGRITASSYFQVVPTSSNMDLDDEDVSYEYVALVLKYDHYSYYDTTASMKLNVHYVNEEIVEDDDGTLYSDKTFSVDDTPLGSITFSPRPNRTADSVEIRLSDELGRDLFAKAVSGSDELSTSAEFLRHFRGLAVFPDSTSSTCLLGFAVTPELRVYYKDKSTVPITTDNYLSFAASTSNIIYTHIHTDLTGTKIASLTETDVRLSADETDEQSYLQAGAGLLLRVDMPYLRTLKQIDNFYPTQATLDIYPIRKSYDDQMPLPSSLVVYTADKKNNFYAQYGINATLLTDTDLGRYTRYTLDVTSFVKEQMELEELNENGLVFSLAQNFPVSVDRIYAGSNGVDYETRLRIYFVTVNNKN